jgi:hypothetical protein
MSAGVRVRAEHGNWKMLRQRMSADYVEHTEATDGWHLGIEKNEIRQRRCSSCEWTDREQILERVGPILQSQNFRLRSRESDREQRHVRIHRKVVYNENINTA